MENQSLSLEKFNPTTAELTALAEKSRKLEVKDLGDKATLALVHDYRMELKAARVTIEKSGKAIREDALKFQKAVIAKERELIALIEPEELRLEQIEKQAKDHALMEERKRKLPERMERLKTVGGDFPEENVLKMDDVMFEGHFNRLQAEKNAKEAAEIEQKRREQEEKLAAEKREQDAKLEAARREQEEKDRELKEREAKLEAEKKAIEDAKEAERKAAEEKIEAEKKAAEELEKQKQLEEQARRNQMDEERFEAWLAENGWTSENQADFIITDDGLDAPEILLFKKISAFKKTVIAKE